MCERRDVQRDQRWFFVVAGQRKIVRVCRKSQLRCFNVIVAGRQRGKTKAALRVSPGGPGFLNVGIGNADGCAGNSRSRGSSHVTCKRNGLLAGILSGRGILGRGIFPCVAGLLRETGNENREARDEQPYRAIAYQLAQNSSPRHTNTLLHARVADTACICGRPTELRMRKLRFAAPLIPVGRATSSRGSTPISFVAHPVSFVI